MPHRLRHLRGAQGKVRHAAARQTQEHAHVRSVWRDHDLVEACGVGEKICSRQPIAEIASKSPRDEVALAQITGLGTRKIARFGAALIETVARFKPHPLLDNKLSPTVNVTLAMHIQGMDPAKIAAARGLDVSTIWAHFAEAIEAGLIEARTVIRLDEAEIDEILGVFERLETVDTGRLGPAHAALEGRYDYGILKCLLAEIA